MEWRTEVDGRTVLRSLLFLSEISFKKCYDDVSVSCTDHHQVR